MKRAVLIITDADEVGYQELHRTSFGEHARPFKEASLSEQLLADLRTLQEFPRLLATTFEDPRVPYAEVQVNVDDWEDAEAAAARVRALLPEEDGT